MLFRKLALALAAAAALSLAWAPRPFGAPPEAEAAGTIALQPIVSSGLASPNGIVSPPGDSRLFILQQGGQILIWNGAQLLPRPFLDISSSISTGNEQGLLGLAFHPQYAANGYFYIDYTDASGDIVVARYRVSGDSNVALTAAAPIMTIPHPGAANHNGGQLQFGPGGKLYISVGDGGDLPDAGAPAQRLDSLLGKILRIDVDAASPYAIPPDNPFVSTAGARGEIWAWGLRNPWRFSFDRATGDAFIADVGEAAREEMDFQQQAAGAGVNYGWPIMEGSACYSPPSGCGQSGLRLPALEYGHTGGRCAITGGYRYRGSAASFAGTYVYGDFCSGEIWGATKSGPTWATALLLSSGLSITSFGEDRNGELYVVDYYGGGVYKLTFPDSDNDGVPDVNDNCVSVSNPGQENADGNFISLAPRKPSNDLTWINSDAAGDACDADADNDGLQNADEVALGPGQGRHALCPSASAATDPLKLDSDGDRYADGAECLLGADPADAASKPPAVPPSDADRDMLPDAIESRIGTDPNNPDTDGDGLTDGVEYLRYASNPLLANTDGDVCNDGKEVASVNMDTNVNSIDLLAVASSFGPSSSQSYVPDFDMDRNGTIDSVDLLFVAGQFGAC